MHDAKRQLLAIKLKDFVKDPSTLHGNPDYQLIIATHLDSITVTNDIMPENKIGAALTDILQGLKNASVSDAAKIYAVDLECIVRLMESNRDGTLNVLRRRKEELSPTIIMAAKDVLKKSKKEGFVFKSSSLDHSITKSELIKFCQEVVQVSQRFCRPNEICA